MKTKTLTLRRETLRTLTSPQLATVAGGRWAHPMLAPNAAHTADCKTTLCTKTVACYPHTDDGCDR